MAVNFTDDGESSGFEDAANFPNGGGNIGDVHEYAKAENRIETVFSIGKMKQTPPVQGNFPGQIGFPNIKIGMLQNRDAEVESDNLTAGSGKTEGMVCGPTACIEDKRSGGKIDFRQYPAEEEIGEAAVIFRAKGTFPAGMDIFRGEGRL